MLARELTRTCRECGEAKALDEFYRRKMTRDGLRHERKSCNNKYVRGWQKANPEKVKVTQRRYCEANPQVLCKRCNSSKGARHSTDYRPLAKE